MNRKRELAADQAGKMIDKHYDIYELTEVLEKFINEVERVLNQKEKYIPVSNNDLSECAELLQQRNLFRLMKLQGGVPN